MSPYSKYEQELKLVAIQCAYIVETMKYFKAQFKICEFDNFVDLTIASLIQDLSDLKYEKKNNK